MLKRAVAAALLALALLSFPSTAQVKATAVAASGTVTQFPTDTGAQAHCPRDAVVWLDTASSVYPEKGMRRYGRTKHSAYVCQKEADAAGDRDTRNGQ